MTIDGVRSLSDRNSLQAMNRYVDELLQKNIYNRQNPNWNGTEFLAYKNYLVTVSKAMAGTNGLEFAALQSAFKQMNPGPIGTGKIWNPATMFGAPPGAIGRLTDNADIPAASSDGITRASQIADKANKSKREAQNVINEKLNMYSPDAKMYEKTYVDIRPGNGGTDGTTQADTGVPGVSYAVPDYSRLFERQSLGPDFGDGQKGYGYSVPNKNLRVAANADIRRERKSIENDDVFHVRRELEDGYVDVSEGNEDLPDNLTDAGNYMPFFLEDLRSNGKRVYFRAFFKNLRESIAPDWAQEKYFGRVEPVGIYQGTSRTVSVSFAVAAMSPAGFTSMWKKLNALSKMLYPTYANGVMVKAPVCRLRIGDLICDDAGRGLTGYISSPIELDYTDAPWEISEWTGHGELETGKAPMLVLVSFTYQIIHERQPQLDGNYDFDTSVFRRIGGLPLTSEQTGIAEMTFTDEEVGITEDET